VLDKLDGRSRGFGFVEMENDRDVERAVKQLNGAMLMGRPMRVEQATTSRGGPPAPAARLTDACRVRFSRTIQSIADPVAVSEWQQLI